MKQTQATTDETKTLTVNYTKFGLDLGTDDDLAAYELRNAEQTPDDLDDDTLDTVYDEQLEIDVPVADVEKHDTTLALLESIYHGIEHDAIDQVDRTEYRSPMNGDVFVFDGTAYVVARIGFDELESAPERFE